MYKYFWKFILLSIDFILSDLKVRKFTNAVQKYFCGHLSTVKFWIICLYFVAHSFEMGHVFNGWNLQVLQLSFYETKMHKGCHKIPLICSKSLTPSMTTFNALSLWRTCAYIINCLKKNKEKKWIFQKIHKSTCTSDPMDPTDCYPTYLYLRPIMPPTYDRRQPPKYMPGQ